MSWPSFEKLKGGFVLRPLSRWVPPRRRGRPSQALQHLIERWCAWPRFTVEPPQCL